MYKRQPVRRGAEETGGGGNGGDDDLNADNARKSSIRVSMDDAVQTIDITGVESSMTLEALPTSASLGASAADTSKSKAQGANADADAENPFDVSPRFCASESVSYLASRSARSKQSDTSTPCVVERAFEDMPCLQTFRDDDHLKRICGHRDVLVRTTCIPDGAGRHVFIEGGAHMGKFGTYIDACAASRARGEASRGAKGSVASAKRAAATAESSKCASRHAA